METPQEQEAMSQFRENATTPLVITDAVVPVQQKETKQVNTPGTLILQWLTYAFWGWTILALVWLSFQAINFLYARNIGSFGDTSIAYSIAAVLVLYIISILCDMFYARKEPQHKTGAAVVIMVIHAVIFALCGIGAAITAVFSGVNLIISNSGSDGSAGVVAGLLTGVLIALVYGVTLLRTLRPKWLKKTPLIYWLFMTVFTIAMLSIAVFGPAANARLTKNDRLIEDNLTGVSGAINTYSNQNKKLPGSLSDIKDTVSSSTRELIEKNLVEYIPGSLIVNNQSMDQTLNSLDYNNTSVFSYKLCVTYVAAAADRGGYDYSNYSNEASTSPETDGHDKGKVCYPLQTGDIY